MNRNRIIKISLLLVAALGVIASFHVFFNPTVAKGDTLHGNYTLLVLTVDPSEPRPGPGAVDMAFVVNVKNGTISHMTPIYPGNMTHPTASPPSEIAQNGSKLFLHDTMWWNDTDYDAKLAQETVQYNTGIKTDGVVIIKPAAVDALINAVGPIYVSGQGYVNISSIDFLREEQKEGMSRGEAVQSLADAIKNASYFKSKRSAVFNVVHDQCSKGNIIIVPASLYNDLMSEETLNKIFS